MYDAAELSQLPGLLAGELISIGRALAGTTRENICAILDVAIARATVSESLAYERLENMLFAEQRADDAETERDEAITRAKAAEDTAKRTQAELEELKVLFHAVSLELTIVSNWTRRLLRAIDANSVAGDTIASLTEKLKEHIGYNYDEAPSHTEIQNRWMDELSAALARAEAAKVELEAEVRDLRDRVGEATEAAAEWQDAYAMNEVYGPTQLEMLRARVAKLEAALAAERAANAWRPVSTVPLEQEVLLLVCGEVYGPPGHQWVCTYDAPFSGWRPNAPQEPTQ